MSQSRNRLPRVISVISVIVLALSWRAGAQDGAPAEPQGYRLGEYRAAVPETLEGAQVISTKQAEALFRAKTAVFIDVLPRPVRPANLPNGTVWRDKPRYDIPGSIWLPNVGYGALSAEMEAYFRKGLSDAVGGDTAHPIIIYCLADCWMSWNAAKRALEYGHGNVLWYPAGTDGWQRETTIELQERAPVALPQP